METSNFTFKKEKVVDVIKKDDLFTVKTVNNEYIFDYVIITTGGHGNGCELASRMGHTIVDIKPALTALDIEEKDLYFLSGMCFKNVEANFKAGKKKITCFGDFLFTHKSISGPCVFKISSESAYVDFNKDKPLEIVFKFFDYTVAQIETEIKNNPKKTIKNLFSKFAPENFISKISEINSVEQSKQIAQMKNVEKEILINSLINFKLHAIKRVKDSEIVTAGGVDLNEIDSKTMQSKITKGLYFAGEVLNIDGYTGGFNLQSCWSGAYIVSGNFN